MKRAAPGRATHASFQSTSPHSTRNRPSCQYATDTVTHILAPCRLR